MKKVLDILSSIFSKEEFTPESRPVAPIELVLNCMEKDIIHLDSLVRYYENPKAGYAGVFSRALWLLTLMRDTEVDSDEVNIKKFAIIQIDPDGQITNISPITLL